MSGMKNFFFLFYFTVKKLYMDLTTFIHEAKKVKVRFTIIQFVYCHPRCHWYVF